VRPLMNDHIPSTWWLHVAVLAGYAAAGFYASLVLIRRRLLS
jgi:hypothetical protein